ncbi:class I SAM-dependent methyltransferase [Streptomyces sp. NPDC056237]|uniref:class I SAM-dependent methyltransferase n=1 Tax=unclassified Streptomyces TaxID=2593676 RepID=UPI0035DFDCDF
MTTDEDELYDADEDLYALALEPGRAPVYLRLTDRRRTRLPVHRWCAQPTRADQTLLERCVGPVLDIGCGPGRLCRALLCQGVFALGIDVASHAVARTIALGGTAQCRSVFDPLPGEGDWQTLLLADGNIGIGGDPHALVRRCTHLISPTGVLLVEVDNDDVEERCTAWFEDTHGHRGPAFPWARLGAPALRRITDGLGLRVIDQWKSGPRTFLALGHLGPSRAGAPHAGRAMP